MEAILRLVKPNFVFYDFGFWIPNLGRSLGFKSVHYSVVCAASNALMFGPSLEMHINSASLLADLIFEMPPGYPLPKVQLRKREAYEASALIMHETGSGLTLYERVTKSMKECDAIAIRTCREIEGPFCDYISQQYNKTVLLSGHVLPETTTPRQEKLGEPWAEWLSKFKPNSVVFCALGSHIVLDEDQFQELLLGFELSRLPFLVALKPPKGCTTIEEALPEGFKERVEGRGWVDGGWVPQPAILGHPSVGCFVSHCGFGSMWESLLSKCQIVLFPHLPDQILDARLLVEELKVAVEVEKDIESGWLRKDSLCKAIKSVMDEENKMGYELRSNHGKYREILSSKNFQSAYTDGLIQNLQDLMD